MSVAIATGRPGTNLAQNVSLDSGHTIVFDESEAAGGDNLGMSPIEGLGACLAACTAVTLRLYADRKEWDLSGLRVIVETTYVGYKPSAFKVKVEYPPGLEEAQIERLGQIAAKCPVHQTLAGSVPVEVA